MSKRTRKNISLITLLVATQTRRLIETPGTLYNIKQKLFCHIYRTNLLAYDQEKDECTYQFYYFKSTNMLSAKLYSNLLKEVDSIEKYSAIVQAKSRISAEMILSGGLPK